MQGCGDEPGPEVEELQKRFGVNAAEYAKVRAAAAANSGNPDAVAWQIAARQLLEEQTQPTSKPD